MTTPMLSLENVTKAYGGTAAIQSLTLKIDPMRTTALIGPSGCGKSTVLRLMAGLIRPDSGTVRFGADMLTPGNIQQFRRRIGYVIQDGGLFPHLTARANVTLMARQLKLEKAAIDRKVEELAALVRLEMIVLNRFPSELSGGQRQRVSLMRALALDPDVLLLDEPLGALDPMIRFDLQGDLLEIFRRLQKTVVLVTHDLNEAAFFADTIVLMRGGEIVQQGAVGEVLDNPADEFVKKFVTAQRGRTRAEDLV